MQLLQQHILSRVKPRSFAFLYVVQSYDRNKKCISMSCSLLWQNIDRFILSRFRKKGFKGFMSYSKPCLSYLAFKSGNPIYLFHSFECIQRSPKDEKLQLKPTAFCLIEFWQESWSESQRITLPSTKFNFSGQNFADSSRILLNFQPWNSDRRSMISANTNISLNIDI